MQLCKIEGIELTNHLHEMGSCFILGLVETSRGVNR
jgi:hypothetical protein